MVISSYFFMKKKTVFHTAYFGHAFSSSNPRFSSPPSPLNFMSSVSLKAKQQQKKTSAKREIKMNKQKTSKTKISFQTKQNKIISPKQYHWVCFVLANCSAGSFLIQITTDFFRTQLISFSLGDNCPYLSDFQCFENHVPSNVCLLLAYLFIHLLGRRVNLPVFASCLSAVLTETSVYQPRSVYTQHTYKLKGKNKNYSCTQSEWILKICTFENKDQAKEVNIIQDGKIKKHVAAGVGHL